MGLNKIRTFFRWSRDNQEKFADEISAALELKADKTEVSAALDELRDNTSGECDTSDKVSKSGDTMTGNLTIGDENADSIYLQIIRKSGAYKIGGFITDNGQGLTFGSYNSGSRNTLYAMSNGPTLGFYPLHNNLFSLGNSIYRWTNVYAAKLNNGADIEIPNKAGTLALLSDIPDADTSDKVSKSGDTITGELSIGLPTGSGATTFPIALKGKFSDTSTEYIWRLGISTLSPIFYIKYGTQHLVGISPSLGIFPEGNPNLTLGYNNRPWVKIFTKKLNNGEDIEVPTKAGTLALLSDIEDVLQQHGLIQ